MLDHRPTKLLITGKSGSGKTTYWERFVVGSRYEHTFVFDQERELCVRLGIDPAETFADLEAAMGEGIVIWDPSIEYPGRLEEAFAFFCEWVFEVGKTLPGKKLFCADELQKIVGTDDIAWELALVLETGRRHGIDAALVSQAPHLIHNRIRNMLTEVVTFAHVDARAIKWHTEVGFEEDEIRALVPGEYLARNMDTGRADRGRLWGSSERKGGVSAPRPPSGSPASADPGEKKSPQNA